MKLPPAWHADPWICHHQNHRSSTRLDSHPNSASKPKRVSTAQIRRRIDDLGLGSADPHHPHHSDRSSKVKRLNDSISQKSYKSFLSFTSRRTPMVPIRVPKMSKQSFKRWLDARDAYLGHQFPFLRQRPKSRRRARHRRRRRPPGRNHSHSESQTRPSSIKTTEKSINDDDDENDEAISNFTFDSERLNEQKTPSREQSRRKDNTSRSENNLCRSGLLERIKSFVQSPARSLSCLSLRRRTASGASSQSKKKTEIIHDHFDDKCVGTEISDFRSLRSAYSRQDQSIQVDLVRPQIELHYEFDPTMVDGEKQVRRIRSVRTRVELSDKTTETEFISTWPNVEKEEKEERKKCNDDKATCPSQIETEPESYIKAANVERTSSTPRAHQSISMPNSPVSPPNKSSVPTSKCSTPSNRIVPLTDLLQTSMKNDQDQRTKSATIASPTESNLSIQEQLQRLRSRFNRLSKERRILTCLLALFALIMCGLLIGIFILSWAFQGQTPIIYREITNSTDVHHVDGASEQHERQSSIEFITDRQTTIFHLDTTLSTTSLPLTMISTEKQLARYGESCDQNNDCESPFICHRKGSSTAPGMCRCPAKYDFVKDQCVGDLNAICTKDSDCQTFMHCSGVNDGTRRCQCQKQYFYDQDRKRCRGDFHAPCETTLDCQSNLICNKTAIPSFCSCEFHYQYHPSLRKCRGDPGAVCDRATAECVDNAECRDGACECAQQYIPDENKVCVDPCPANAPYPARIRYPGNCRRFIDCQMKSKTECPEMTIFNLRTQLCDYPKNVFDC